MTFGNRLLDINTLLDGDDRRSLDLMNKYDLQVNKWEHQGYEMRENYWNSLMNLYITSASLMKTSLIARMEEYKKYLPNSRANFLEGVMTLLEKQLEKIVQLADETAVKRLDSNIRHYQKPGHDVYMYTSTVKQDISNLIKTAYIYNYKSEAENKVNKFWVPMYTVQSGSLKGKVGLTAQEYQMIYDDYNPKGSKTRYLCMIFSLAKKTETLRLLLTLVAIHCLCQVAFGQKHCQVKGIGLAAEKIGIIMFVAHYLKEITVSIILGTKVHSMTREKIL